MPIPVLGVGKVSTVMRLAAKSAGGKAIKKSIQGTAGKGDSGGPTTGNSISGKQRAEDLAANAAGNPPGHYWCTHCGYENSNSRHFDVDNIVPRSHKGNTNPNNRRILCVGCNRSAQEGRPPLTGSDWASKHPDWDMRP